MRQRGGEEEENNTE